MGSFRLKVSVSYVDLREKRYLIYSISANLGQSLYFHLTQFFFLPCFIFSVFFILSKSCYVFYSLQFYGRFGLNFSFAKQYVVGRHRLACVCFPYQLRCGLRSKIQMVYLQTSTRWTGRLTEVRYFRTNYANNFAQRSKAPSACVASFYQTQFVLSCLLAQIYMRIPAYIDSQANTVYTNRYKYMLYTEQYRKMEICNDENISRQQPRTEVRLERKQQSLHRLKCISVRCQEMGR